MQDDKPPLYSNLVSAWGLPRLPNGWLRSRAVNRQKLVALQPWHHYLIWSYCLVMKRWRLERGREEKSWRLRAEGASLLTNPIIYTNYLVMKRWRLERGREGKSWRLRAEGASSLTNLIIYTNYFISSSCSNSTSSNSGRATVSMIPAAAAAIAGAGAEQQHHQLQQQLQQGKQQQQSNCYHDTSSRHRHGRRTATPLAAPAVTMAAGTGAATPHLFLIYYFFI